MVSRAHTLGIVTTLETYNVTEFFFKWGKISGFSHSALSNCVTSTLYWNFSLNEMTFFSLLNNFEWSLGGASQTNIMKIF